MAEDTIDHSELLALTSDIVAAHASNNAVPSTELSGLIEAVFGTLSSLSEPAEPVEYAASSSSVVSSSLMAVTSTDPRAGSIHSNRVAAAGDAR